MTPQDILLEAYKGLAADFTEFHQDFLKYTEETVNSIQNVEELGPTLEKIQESEIDPILKQEVSAKIGAVMKSNFASTKKLNRLLIFIHQMAKDAEERAQKFYDPDEPL